MGCGCKETIVGQNGAFHVKQPPTNEVESEALAGPPTERDVSNTAALSIECLVADLGLERADAEWLVALGVGCSSNDDALSVLGHALVASIERAQELEKTLDTRELALEKVQQELEDVENQLNDMLQALDGAHSVVEDEDGDG